ncbi:MAG TPA: LysR family transcriptional regulator, partial [Verrucomicrobiae bacterium]|nr:LysR family transcriptional regulator [Verrucomicrobiae bacterium]
MNLKQLEVFLSVAETCSFSRAAEATFITQSTVSQHISSLEGEFGVRLFDRTAKGALLTEGGKLLRNHALQVMAESRRLREAMSRFTGLQEAELRLAASSIPGTYLIPRALPVLLQRFPGITVKLWQGDSREAAARIAADEAETGVVGDIFEDPRLEFTPFGSDRIVLILPPGHRWSGGTVPLRAVEEERLILREAGSGTGRTVLSSLEQHGLRAERLEVKAFLGSNEAVKGAV